MSLDHPTRRLTAAMIAAGAASAWPAAAAAQISINPRGIREMVRGISIDEKDEVALGRKLFGPFVDMMGGRYANSQVQRAVARAAEPVLAVSGRSAFTWEVAVVDSNEVNAWALPGGKIGLNKGLLRYIDSEDELAAVIAHEMGHAEHSHSAKAMRGQTLRTAAVGAAAAAATANSDRPVAAGAGLAALDLAILSLVASGYARDQEREADANIAKVFAKTGHDLRRGAQFYRTLLELTPPDTRGRTSLFAGHPETRERMQALLASAPATSPPARPAGAEFTAVKSVFPTRKVYQRRPL